MYKNCIEMSEWLGQPGQGLLNCTENVWKVGKGQTIYSFVVHAYSTVTMR